MVEIVSDDYFPPEDDMDASSSSSGGEVGTISVGGITRRFAWMFPTSSIPPFSLGIKGNETLLESVNAVRVLMEDGKLEAARRLAEEQQLDISLTAVNTTLLVDMMNTLLNGLALPMYAFVSSHLRGHLMDFLGAVTQTLYSSSSGSDSNSNSGFVTNNNNNNNNATTMTNSHTSGAKVEEVRPLTPSWFGILSTNHTRRFYAEMAMFLVCVGLCILLFLVRLRFAKYFRGIDIYTSQPSHANHSPVSQSHLNKKKSNYVEDSFMLPPAEEEEGGEHHHSQVQQGLPFLLEHNDDDGNSSPPRLSYTM